MAAGAVWPALLSRKRGGCATTLGAALSESQTASIVTKYGDVTNRPCHGDAGGVYSGHAVRYAEPDSEARASGAFNTVTGLRLRTTPRLKTLLLQFDHRTSLLPSPSSRLDHLHDRQDPIHQVSAARCSIGAGI